MKWNELLRTKWIMLIVVALLNISILAACSDIGEPANKNDSSQGAVEPETDHDSEDSNEKDIEASEIEKVVTADSVENLTDEPEQASDLKEDLPREHQSALNTAKTYAGMMHMSKKGIFDQLVSEHGENFSEDAAQYAIDHVEADWNENALKTAETYSDTMHMSKQGIYDQLISNYGEQFTIEEAQYAIDQLEADWNKNALETAKSYAEMDMSNAVIYDQLISDYGEQFTAEQAQYAVDHLDE